MLFLHCLWRPLKAQIMRFVSFSPAHQYRWYINTFVEGILANVWSWSSFCKDKVTFKHHLSNCFSLITNKIVLIYIKFCMWIDMSRDSKSIILWYICANSSLVKFSVHTYYQCTYQAQGSVHAMTSKNTNIYSTIIQFFHLEILFWKSKQVSKH